jgi:hypothetical protein
MRAIDPECGGCCSAYAAGLPAAQPSSAIAVDSPVGSAMMAPVRSLTTPDYRTGRGPIALQATTSSGNRGLKWFLQEIRRFMPAEQG